MPKKVVKFAYLIMIVLVVLNFSDRGKKIIPYNQ